jgi:hypothetical protein
MGLILSFADPPPPPPHPIAARDFVLEQVTDVVDAGFTSRRS